MDLLCLAAQKKDADSIAQALDGFRAKMIAMRVGDKDILHAVQYMWVIAMLRIVKYVRTGINQQIAIDQHRRESPMKNAGCVGVNVPVRRAGSEKGQLHGTTPPAIAPSCGQPSTDEAIC